MHITGSRDLIRIHRDLEYLSELGLLKTNVKSQSFSPIETTNIAPTSLGLQLFARCNGHRGAAQEFYGVSRSELPRIPGEPELVVPDEAPL